MNTTAITRRSTRRLGDAYFTHEKLTQALVDRVHVSGTILEPCAGTGMIANALASPDSRENPDKVGQPLSKQSNIGANNLTEEGCPTLSRFVVNRSIVTNDINSEYQTDFQLDATKPETWERIVSASGVDGIDWVVTNPPFNQASFILPLAYQHVRTGLASLLRLSWLEPTGSRSGDRGQWLSDHADNLSQVIIFSQPRPSFTGDGKTDGVTTAWCVWRKDWSWEKLGVSCPFHFAYGWEKR